IVFSVIDKGKGIEEKYLAKIFDRYFKVPGQPQTGTGLGLAISKEFIEAQGGTITVKSAFGEGSNFTFQIPVSINQLS
ncbi:HAMP domain-containing sensor histidine kinase, partial [Acinetobacter baumannii]